MRLLVALGLCMAGPSFASQPFSIQHAETVRSADAALIYRDGSALILRDQLATPRDFQDLYVVKTPEWFAIPSEIADLGEVVQFVPTKFAVMRIDQKNVEQVSGLLHQGGLACGGIFRMHGDTLVEAPPAVPQPMLPIGEPDEFVLELASAASADNIRATVTSLSEVYTRYHGTDTGRGVAEWLVSQYQSLAANRDDVTVEVYDHGSDTAQDSILVRIEGQTRPDEVIILGSHIDSVNWRDGTRSRAPGADDNASGTSTNLEIFRLLMDSGVRLHRTLEIHGYAAEEVGLVGSQNMARRYKADGVNVVAMVQQDMNLYKAPGTVDKIWFVTSNTLDAFNDALGVLVDHYAGVPWEKKSLSGGDSDHTSWTRQGYAAAFPFENPSSYNRHIHTRDDTIANSGAFDQAAAFAKLGVSYVSHFGGIYR